MRLLISAGEASGESYGAQLIAALKKREPELDCSGVGGEAMRAAGCRTAVDAKDIAVVGIAEVATRLPKIWGEFRRLLRAVDAQKPDAAVLIDFPDWNLRLARELHARGIPVVYYISPQLWAWRPKRIEQIKRHVRKMLVIFPFEERWYRERGVEAEYVGHPLADLPAPDRHRRCARRKSRLRCCREAARKRSRSISRRCCTRRARWASNTSSSFPSHPPSAQNGWST